MFSFSSIQVWGRTSALLSGKQFPSGSRIWLPIAGAGSPEGPALEGPARSKCVSFPLPAPACLPHWGPVLEQVVPM